MDIQRVAEIVDKIADGFTQACVKCIGENSEIILQSIMEQLWCGQDGDGNFLSPTYDNDPFFQEEGVWQGRSAEYKEWKRVITPPQCNYIFPLGLSSRPDNVPNLYINGKFYGEITATLNGDILVTGPGNGNGGSIVEKYGDKILDIGPNSVEYFNANIMLPAIGDFFKKCGYK